MFDWLHDGWLLAGGAAVLTVVASGWQYVRQVWMQLASRIVVRVTISGYAADAVRLYLKAHFAPSRFGPREYLGWMLYVRPRRRVQLVPLETTPKQGRIYWRGWRPLWVARTWGTSDEIESGVNARDWSDENLTLLMLRGSFDPDRLLIDSAEWYNRQVVENLETEGRRHTIRHVHGTAGKPRLEMPRRRDSSAESSPSSSADIRGCLHHRSLTWTFCDIGPEQSRVGTACDQLALSPAAADLVAEAHVWKQSEEWHRERGIPWRRGWLLHGRPGTGKTALARAISEDLDLPVVVYDLASLHNNELQQAWSQMLSEVPCMALIEDIDAVFEGRRNVNAGADKQNLTFDCLLNCIDGIQRADGLLIVLTTNHLNMVDPALGVPGEQAVSTRPGRIDRVVEMTDLDEAGRRKLASRILEDAPGEWQGLIEHGAGDSAAQFQERCARLALELHFPRDGRQPRQTQQSVSSSA